MLTLFTWEYWGWGNTTREFVRAADATERKRGFKPPVFVDIRYRRNVRAKGFLGDAFERSLPGGRYQWLPRLGNRHAATGERGIKIADPPAAKILLEEAIRLAKDKRRVIFFCACESPRYCHRHIVANLVLKQAAQIGRGIEIVEWPGGKPIRTKVQLKLPVYDAVCRGLVNIPLPRERPSGDLICLPWGSIADIESGKQNFPIITGPAMFTKGAWSVPIWERCEPDTPEIRLRSLSGNFRKRRGYEPSYSLRRKNRGDGRPKILTTR